MKPLQAATTFMERPASVLEMAHGLLAGMWRRRHVIVLPILILPFAGFVVGKFAPRTYETRMTLLVQDTGKISPSVSDISVSSNLKDRMEALKALLISHRVLLGVAEDLNMIAKDAPRILQDDVVKGLEAAVSVRLIGNEMLEFTYRAGKAEGMDKVLARIGQRFVERVMAPEDTAAKESVAFLEKQLMNAEVLMLKGDSDLAAYKAKNAQALPDQRQSNLARLAMQRDQLDEHEILLSGVKSELSALNERLLQTDPVIGRLEQDIVNSSADLAQLKARYMETHSAVVAAEHKLESLEAERARLIQISQNAPPIDMKRLWNLIAAQPGGSDGKPTLLVSQVSMLEVARTKFEKLQTETENLRRNVAELEARLAESGEVERVVRERERDIAAQSENVAQLRKRFTTAKSVSEYSEFQATDRVKLVDAPVEPSGPTRPMTLMFVLGGLFGGVFLGGSIGCFLEMLDPSVRRIRDMERIVGVQVLDRVPPLPTA